MYTHFRSRHKIIVIERNSSDELYIKHRKTKTGVLIGESIIVWGVGLSIFLTAVMIKNLNGIWLVFVICGVLQILAFLYYILKNDKISFKNLFKKKKKDNE